MRGRENDRMNEGETRNEGEGEGRLRDIEKEGEREIGGD